METRRWTVTDRNILEKHLYDYTRRNTFDYFIHKDLGKFLRRELDFYIKNEVMHLDDVENESVPRVEQYLSKIKVIRKIAHKIIDFLAQIEDFQKKLWLKKKFVVETNYCVTLDRVPEELYSDIAANDAQREEWVRLFVIDEITKDLAGAVDYSEPLTFEFLKANPHLLIDTKYFRQEFKDRLLAGFENLDEHLDGLIVHGDNFHALSLIRSRHRNDIDCVYIDPPYNTGEDGFAYKDIYQHSSWLTFLHSRLCLLRLFLKDTGVIFSSIDDIEYHNLRKLFSDLFGESNFIDNIIWKKRYGGGAKEKYLVSLHEYILFFANDIYALKNILVPLDEESIARYYKLKDKYFSIRGPYRTHPLEATKSVGIRENLIYPIPAPDGTQILPERQWWWEKDRTMKALHKGELEFIKTDKGWTVHTKQYLKDENGVQRQTKATSIIDNVFTQHGTTEIDNLFGDSRTFLFPKPSALISQLLKMAAAAKNDVVMDIVAGSGTTAHAVINLNREDGGSRKYILVEMGDYFDTVLKPRIQKVVYSKDWKDGKPVSREGVSHMFKYIRLESYEDALANLQLKRSEVQESLLKKSDSFRESYMLRYMLDTETKGSSSLLDLDQFENPFSYKLLVGTGSVGETKPVNVDLVETFNWLLGLKVKHMDHIGGFRIVEGMNPKGEKVLVIWRKIRDLAEKYLEKIQRQQEKSNEDLEAFFKKQQYNTMDMEFDIIYVNGDNNLMNIPMAPEGEGLEPRYKVRLIEEEFKRLMFDVKDV